jgi:7-cyano-7-deazaguanine reductase
MKTKYLGNKEEFSGLDVVEIANAPDEVSLRSDEVTALCPVTSQPDIYSVYCKYRVADGRILETKSFKMYLVRFRDKGIFCEELCSVILDDLWNALFPEELYVSVKQAARGGITTLATSERHRPFDLYGRDAIDFCLSPNKGGS